MSAPTVALLPVVVQTPLTAAGLPSPSDKFVFTLSGTSTPADVYNDVGAVISTAGVVTADSNGQFPAIYLDVTKAYRVDLQTAAGASFPNYPQDNVTAAGTSGGSGSGLDIVQIQTLIA